MLEHLRLLKREICFSAGYDHWEMKEFDLNETHCQDQHLMYFVFIFENEIWGNHPFRSAARVVQF